MFWLHVSVWCFDGFFVWVVSLLAGDRPMSSQFQKVNRPPMLPITDQFPQHQYCQRCLSVWWRFVWDDLWNTVVCFQPPSLLIGKVWVPAMRFRVSHTLESALKSRQEARILQIDFGAAFDGVNHQGIL